MDELEEELEDESYSENSQSIPHTFSEFYITQEDREILRLLQTSKRVMERNIRQDRYCKIRAQRTRTFHIHDRNILRAYNTGKTGNKSVIRYNCSLYNALASV